MDITNVSKGNELLAKLRKMRMLADDEDEVVSTTTSNSQSAQPAWMRTLHERCREWLDQLPSVSGCSANT